MFRIMKKFTQFEWTMILFELLLVLLFANLLQNGAELLVLCLILAVFGAILGLCFYSTISRIQAKDLDLLTTEIAELGTTYNMVVESLNKYHNMAENAIKKNQALVFSHDETGQTIAIVIKRPEEVKMSERVSFITQIENDLIPEGLATFNAETFKYIIPVGRHEIRIPYNKHAIGDPGRIVIHSKAVKVEEKKPVKTSTKKTKKK